MKQLKYCVMIVSILTFAAVSLVISGEQVKKTPNPADEAIPALPQLKPLFDFPVRDTSICLGPDGTY